MHNRTLRGLHVMDSITVFPSGTGMGMLLIMIGHALLSHILTGRNTTGNVPGHRSGCWLSTMATGNVCWIGVPLNDNFLSYVSLCRTLMMNNPTVDVFRPRASVFWFLPPSPHLSGCITHPPHSDCRLGRSGACHHSN